MSRRTSLPKYIPPPTTFLLSRSGVTYGTKPLPNRHWNLVRTNVQNHRLKGRDRDENGVPVYDDQRKWRQIQDTLKEQSHFKDGTRNTKDNGVKRQSGRKAGSESQQKRFLDGDEEEAQAIEQQPIHFAQPDLHNMFDDVDNCNENKEKSKHEGARSTNSNDSEMEGQNGDYDNDVDWQKKIENDKQYDWSKNRRRNNSMYDPEIANTRAQEIEQRNNKARSRDRDMHSQKYKPSKKPDLVNKGNEQVNEGGTTVNGYDSDKEYKLSTLAEPESDADEDDNINESNFKENGEEEEDENGKRKEGRKKMKSQRLKNLAGAIKKCTPKFAEKLLDALEKQKSECLIRFDDICKKHKKKDNEPIFTSYSCENGQTAGSFKDSMKKKMCGLIGGVYTKACEGAGAIRDAAEEWLDEVTPQDDGSWSQIDGNEGIRCVSHYDNRIEDHTVYVCSCCFNEIIERDAHVNINYFDPDFGCCKPKIVSRSFENRPYYCEKLLASMPKKRRECLLKLYGKRHQMRGAVHCISVIPSMEEEYLAQQAKLESLNKEEGDHLNEDSRDEN